MTARDQGGERPLAGVRVVELATEIQGPSAGLVLSEMGAEVIKIETRKTGDTSRTVTVGRMVPGVDPAIADFQPYFFAMNRGKRSLSLDLKAPQGKDVLARLLSRADVMLSNFRIGVLDRLGFGYEAAAEKFPRLIYAVASGWGPRGPRTQLPSRDMLAQAASGLMGKTGGDPGPPMPTGANMGDYSGGHMLVSGILAALYQRERTGRGQRVDVSLYGTLIALQQWEMALAGLADREPHRAGHGHPYMSGAWGGFRTADGWLVLSGVQEREWPRFCEIIERPDLAADPQWNGTTRNIHGDAFRPLIENAFVGRPTAEWLALLGPAGILATSPASYMEVLEDQQARECGYVRTVEHPRLGPVRVVGSPIEFSESAPRGAGAAPDVGGDTAAVLAELGYSEAEIASLRAGEVV